MRDAYIGIDLGTSGVRACAIDAAGNVLAETRASLPAPANPCSGCHEQAAALWWEATQAVLDDMLPDRRFAPRAISVDGTSGTLLLCDHRGTPLSQGLMYNDRRAIAEAAQLQTLAPPTAAVHNPSSALAKLLYLQHSLPRAAAHALHQADWVAGRLSGTFGCSDENNALKLGYDPVNRCWPDWLHRTPVALRLLPEVLPVGARSGTLRAELARRWECRQGVAIVAGTTDSNAATLASGIRKAGEASTALGSTLVLKVISEQPVYSAAHGIYSHRLGDRWLVGGASNSGGAVLRQYFSPAELVALSARISPASDSGLDYYPLPSVGERFPLNDPDMRPRLQPRPAEDVHFLHGLLEGIARIEHQGYRKLASLGAPYPHRVLSTGGGAANQAWNRIRQRLLGVPVQPAAHSEAAYGSSLIAAGLCP
jgi:sugar (pentulose or hexulose) kinase